MTAHVADVRVRILLETYGDVLQNSQKVHRIFEEKTAFFGASGAIAVADG